MKKSLFLSVIALFSVSVSLFAQKGKKVIVPTVVKTALATKYPASGSAKVTWEMEKGNYEANWGGKEGEDNSVQFTPAGNFIEIVQAIPVNQLPKAVMEYVKVHHKGVKITEAGKVTDAAGNITYEAEVNKKNIKFDENGKFMKGGD